VLAERKGLVLAMLSAARLRVAPVPPPAPLPSAARDGFGELVGSEERRAFCLSRERFSVRGHSVDCQIANAKVEPSTNAGVTLTG